MGMTVKFLILLLLTGVLAGCATVPPSNINNSCAIFREKSGWYSTMLAAQKRYGTPISVQLAIIKQESSFKHNARTKRNYIFWVIPWGRVTTAYGYAQVKDATWDWYKSKTGNSGADRDNFADAVDFIGWYTNLSNKVLGISKWDAGKQYLAYNEGQGGYRRKTYLRKKWLMKVARKVERNSRRYAGQLRRCASSLDQGFWFWPF
ncbi:MAG: transglycosylase SLT domain-containing protein [Alphaproteobacteria bacterium]|nr:transglycosylase SLT domain-containing protein [Alphaproteobacteria bacterium]